MLKISRTQASDATILRIEGSLGGRWVQELQTACDAVVQRDGRAVLDLQGVVFVDREGSRLLEALRSDPRVRIDAVSAFVAALFEGGAA
jgi:anti-anti-sigma regulatory factor